MPRWDGNSFHRAVMPMFMANSTAQMAAPAIMPVRSTHRRNIAPFAASTLETMVRVQDADIKTGFIGCMAEYYDILYTIR